MPSDRIPGADIDCEHQIDGPGDSVGSAYNEWQVESILLNSGERERCSNTLLRERFAGDPVERVHPVVLGIDGQVMNRGAHELAADGVLGTMQAKTTSLTVDVSRQFEDSPLGCRDQEMVLDDLFEEFDKVLGIPWC
ncbi:hypothetical protein [Burkholderia ubonensis]|uniref:hypothetical protein n=1 Tax=Burkholderia ubonensis TaxID=101571 RepID=UPI0015CD4D11|nr:hypothetical protein [Burkholderia ubonensis]